METLNNLSSAYAKTGEINMAILCSEEAYRLASEIGDVKIIKNSSKELHTNYATSGSYKKAYKKLTCSYDIHDEKI